MRIKEGDQVEVISGNDRGLRGTVLRVESKNDKVVVSGVKIIKKHQKPRPSGGRTPAQGGIIELVCPQTGEPTRIGIRRDENGEAIRFSKKSGEDID